jgi:6-pyruvoyltetrahydropterin/6-carboxytetrahydropterin synthase
MTQIISATRYHDFSCGHRVVGHESKCAWLHGHNYRVHFRVEATRGGTTLVLDFSVINLRLCQWLESTWDHKFLAWENDASLKSIYDLCQKRSDVQHDLFQQSIVWTPFNPTAENMADYLLHVVAPSNLPLHTICTSVVVEETRKCSAESRLGGNHVR